MKSSHPDSHRITVSVITGLVVERDAISNVCRQQVEELDRYALRNRVPIDVKVFLHGFNVMDPRIVRMDHPLELACDPHFQRSNLVIFHYGIYYPLFDAMPMAPRTAKLVVNYYGITPPPLASAGSQEVLHRSFCQAAHMLAADRVIVNSEFIRGEALAMGVSSERLSILPLPAAFPIPNQVPARTPGSPLRISYLGRIVPAKGVRELVSALKEFAAHHDFTATIMGAELFSCPKTLAEVKQVFSEAPLAGRCSLLLDQPGEVIRDRLHHTDLFIMPSHHEGFCVPLIEAIACGAGVICSDAGAIPETSGRLGLTYRTGSVDGLVNALNRYALNWQNGYFTLPSGPVTPEVWREQAARHLQTFQRERFTDNFCRLVLDGVQTMPNESANLLTNCRIQAMQQFRNAGQTGRENVSIGRHLQTVLAATGRRRRHIAAARPEGRNEKEIRA